MSNDLQSREAPEIIHDVLRSTGQPLSAAVRDYSSRVSGSDLSGVRLHTDASAAEFLASAVGSRAFAPYQNHIAFAAGQYDPKSANGRRPRPRTGACGAMAAAVARSFGGNRTPRLLRKKGGSKKSARLTVERPEGWTTPHRISLSQEA